MRIAVLDTSILLAIARRQLSLDSVLEQLAGYRIVVTKPVVEELHKLANEQGDKGRLARWVLSTIVGRVVETLDEDCEMQKFDERILCTAEKLRALVVTADLEMATVARRRGLAVAVLRKAKRGLEGSYNAFR